MPCNFRHVRLVGGLMGLLLGAIVSHVRAQPPKEDKKAEKENVRIEGKIEDMGQGLLQIKDSAGESYLVKVEGGVKNVFMTGKADPSFLSRGMLVQFTARLDKKGETVEPLRELTVFTPREGEQPGIFSEPQIGAAASGIFSDAEDESARLKKATANEPRSWRVVGVLAGEKSGKLQIAAGNNLIKARLAEDVRIAVDVADLRLARKGDAVQVQGWRYPQQKLRVIANRISVTAAEPFASAKSKPRASRSTPTPAPRTDADAQPSSAEPASPKQ